jgi:UDP-galactopyranose mutase
MEPYYSVNDEKNMSLYQRYKELAEQNLNLILGGHLAEYKYYDMAPIMEKVMGLVSFL